MAFEYIRPSEVRAGDVVQLGDGLWEILDDPVRGDGTLGKPAGAFFAAGRRFSTGAWGPEKNVQRVMIRTDMAHREPRSPGSALGPPGPGVVSGHPRRRSGVITPHGRPVDRGEDRPAPGLALTQRPSNDQRPGSQGERHASGPPRWRDRLRGTAHPELRPAGRCAQASHVHPAAR